MTGRRIPLQGATNFRDLGGYRTGDGRTVKRGMIFRSDALHRLTDADCRVIEGLGIRLVCDLRYAEERASEPSRLPSGVESLHIGLAVRPDPRFADALDAPQRDREAARGYLTANYRQYPLLYAGAYRTLFTRLLGAGDNAVVFHCTAGKDRAGFTAVVVLLTLGVPQSEVLADYLLTNEYWDRGDRVPDDWPPEVVEAIFTAREEYLRAGLAVIAEQFGTFEAYLTEKVQLRRAERDALERRYLE